VIAAAAPLSPVVEVEEQVYTYEDAGNGAGPLWCYGSTCIVRHGDDVFASGLETLKGVEPLNNVRWLLFQRTGNVWKRVAADEKDRTREPCPLAIFEDGRLFLSVNPSLAAESKNGPASPQVLQFTASDTLVAPRVLKPQWAGTPAFTEHSYRGLCVDATNRELLLVNILGHEAQYYSFLDRKGQWSQLGKITFPIGDYEKPEPIRLCYPELALRNRSAHFLAVSDILEPVKAWRDYKLVLNQGKTWDYDFRRLFYTWSGDIRQVPFEEPIEISSREKTAGHISNLDIWLDPLYKPHLLWLETSVDARLREKFFPGVPLTTQLEHCVVSGGKVVQRSTLAVGGEGASSEIPGHARLHSTPDGRLFVIYHVGGADRSGKAISENRILEIFFDGRHGDPVRVALQHPFTNFFTATERGGSPPSKFIDLLGTAEGRPGISYARIRLER
jgi:hypothetical protein